jgi:hypothetical protein
MSTYTPLASITCVANTTTLVFDNIPPTFNDLVLTTSGVSQAAGGGSIALRFNDDIATSNTNYSYMYMFNSASGTTATSLNANSILVNRHSTTTGMGVCHINDYASTSKKKTVISNGGGYNIAIAIGGTWRNTAAISKITMTFESGPGFATGFTANLYGVGTNINANAKATGGDYITTDGTYWYHAFKTTGTFRPNYNLTCDILVVAGGGGGGVAGQYYPGGGGGAGGVLAHATQSLTATNYAITVGAGGINGSNTSTQNAGSQGSNSQFASLTASVGGGYGSNIAISFGGAGGSAGSGAGTAANLAAATAGQGNQAGNPNGFQSAGGGGGAGAVGANASASQNAGAGGAGVNTYTGWGSLTAALYATGIGVGGYIAGGGGGGGSPAYGTVTQALGGSSVGGNGGTLGSIGVTNGATNTGGGGGGGGGTNAVVPPFGNGGKGGSGIVIVRYAV